MDISYVMNKNRKQKQKQTIVGMIFGGFWVQNVCCDELEAIWEQV